MSRRLPTEHLVPAAGDEASATDLLSPLLDAPVPTRTRFAESIGVVVGELIALTDDGCTPLVLYSGQPGTAAIPARTVVDLHGTHIGRPVTLMFENADPSKPIVMGVLREGAGWPLSERPAQVEVDADGERLVVSAQEQIVLRCGKASITLTKAGKVLIQGTYLVSRSSGVNRIKGGSVQLN
jgi:hypothetical protein